ncbi:AraC family transcriptional regulator [Paenibacillus mucilaginosus]|uniref:HTH araC/xylS-type domain-containing protein n=2 Tax=Paenibacillus mucilaginosus TaxID=61624 RepID=F8FF24_PAEMK|nr:hypothetical protein KNP414_01157 [Paenibacillus mucilaginosus KNP414]
MLHDTDRTISKIAISCRFQSASYFSYVFCKEMGIVPQMSDANFKVITP